MTTYRRILFFAASLSIGLPACQTGETQLPKELSPAYADLLAYRHASRDLDSTAYAAGIDSILALYGFDRAGFEESFRQLGSGTDQVNDFFDSTTTRLASPK